MKQIVLSIFLLAILSSSCSKPTENKDSGARVEGIVGYQQPEVAVGGEVDPTGSILTDTHWYSAEPSYHYYRIFVIGSVDSSHLNKRVSISGSLDSIVCNGVERRRRVFPLIRAQQIAVLN